MESRKLVREFKRAIRSKCIKITHLNKASKTAEGVKSLEFVVHHFTHLSQLDLLDLIMIKTINDRIAESFWRPDGEKFRK